MVKLDRIYTRGGDGGQTSLSDGTRVAKHHLRVEAYGTADEANSAIGIARLHTGNNRTLKALDAMLLRIQNDLFDLGADLATPETPDPKYPPLRVVQTQVDRLEAEIDQMNAVIPPLQSFILPGGTPAAAYLHLARTFTRRAERLTVLLAEQEQINPVVIRYLNRLSDHLFVAGRHANNDGAYDILWVPGNNR